MDYTPLLTWLETNSFELFAVFSSLLYLYFSINQRIWLWPTGILSSAVYLVVFAQARLYADAGLSLYYVLVSIYGWYFWWRIAPAANAPARPILRTKPKEWLVIALAAVACYGLLLAALILLPAWLNFPAADLPAFDALTTALSIVATWMLARKYLEQWLLWVFVDALSAAMYFYKGLYPSATLFAIYTVLALVGYYKWLATWRNQAA